MFSRNIDNKGRFARGITALVIFTAAGFGFIVSCWLGIGLLAVGVFVTFEALRGWCVLRACGIRTKV